MSTNFIFTECHVCGHAQKIHKLTNSFICSCCRHISKPGYPLKALSIKQPWAWLIVNGYKKIENRNTLKNFRGKFLIHAGLKYDKNWYTSRQYDLRDDSMPSERFIEKGGIVGYAEITDCVTKSEDPWFVGKYGLVIKHARPLSFIPCKGRLSFFIPEIYY